MSALGFIGAATVADGWIALICLTLAAVGIYAALAPLWATPSLFLRGAAAAGGIAMINAVGNIGGFLGPYLVGWIKDTTGGYGAAMVVLGLSLAIAAVGMMRWAKCWGERYPPPTSQKARYCGFIA